MRDPLAAVQRFVEGLVALFSRRRQERELDEELQQFLQASIDAKLAGGLSRVEAERAARLELGSTAAVKEWTRDVGWEMHVESTWQDVRYAARILRRTPGFTTVAVLTITLGIGTNLAIFTLTDGMLFRPLPYESPEELMLVQAYDRQRGQPYNMVHRVEFEHLRQHHSGITGIAAASRDASWTSIGPNGREVVPTASGTPNLFELLGVTPHLGRVLRPDDAAIEPLPVLLAYDAWRRRYGNDPSVLGRTLRFDQRTVQIVGVLPSRFIPPVQGSLGAWDFFFVKALDLAAASNPRAGVLSPVARLKPGVTLEAAQSETDVLIQQVAQQYPEIDDERALRFADLQFALFELSRPLLWLLVAAAGGVLLITCVNLANLLLARGAGREREIGIRTAIGASRSRVARQLLVESVLLAVAAGLVAFVVGAAVVESLTEFVPEGYQLRSSILEWRTIGFITLLSTAASLLFGLGPALRLAGSDPNLALREPRRSGEGRPRLLRTGPLLVTVEVALTLVLMAATALTAHSLVRLRSVELGFAHKDVVTMWLTAPGPRYTQPEQAFELQMQVLTQLRRLPGVAASAIDIPQVGSYAPMRGLSDGTGVYSVMPEYFDTMGIPLLEGRDFSDAERQRDAEVVVVSAAFARTEWPEQSAVGRTLVRPDEPPLTVIGVAADVRPGYGRSAGPAVYRLIERDSFRRTTLVARGPGDPAALAAAIRTIVQRLDPQLVVPQARTLRETLFVGIRDTQFQTMLFAMFGIAGLLVAAIGIYGVMAHWVNARTREIGVRLALGADPGRLKALVVRQAALPLAVGLVLGLGGALALGRQLQSLLYEITPQDPATLGITALTLLAVGLLAAYVPARRAARVDPLVALRAD